MAAPEHVTDDLAEPAAPARVALLWDERCGFCTAALGALLAWDRAGAVEPVALGSERAARLLAGMSEERRLASWHLVEPGGRVHSAGAAAPPLLRLLPGGRPAAALLERFPGATERVYEAIAARRGALGRTVSARRLERARRRIAAR